MAMFTPFDRTTSAKLDSLLYLIEHEPRRIIRWALCLYKRALESRVTR
jgi:hypothetical protein